MNIELKIKPLSVNQAFQGKRFKTPAYNKFEKDVLFLLPKAKKPLPEKIRLELMYGFSSQLSDIDNPTKLILDILCKKYGFDDRQIWEIEMRKCIVPKGEEFIDIGIYSYLPF